MNKIEEYKKKMNHDVWEDITNLPRKLFQDANLEYHASNSKKPKKSAGEEQE
tara:strand:- start:249 stop:404 length:156 start_codon:yes stop_codon:yes gene_type:complete